MEKNQIYLFLKEIQRQCDFAIISFTDLNLHLADMGTRISSDTILRQAGNLMDQMATLKSQTPIDYEKVSEIQSQMDKLQEVSNEDFKSAATSRLRFWYSIQAFLIATGNISKLLWPTREKITDRGETLRSLLGINESMLFTRDVRNSFEHFDERLETWMITRNGVLFDSNIGSTGSYDSVIRSSSTLPTAFEISDEDILRNFDPSTFNLTFTGQTFELLNVLEEIKNIKEKAGQLISP